MTDETQNFGKKYRIFKEVGLGIYVPKKWENVLEWFGEETEKLMDAGTISRKTRASQVKEKYDTLRIYYSPYDERVENLVSMANAKVRMLESGKPYHMAINAQGEHVSIDVYFNDVKDALEFFSAIKYDEVDKNISEVYDRMKKEGVTDE